MGIGKVWVYAETDGDKVKTITLEMLAKAREIGDTVEAIYGGDASGIAETLGKHGATKVYATGDIGDGLPGAHVTERKKVTPTVTKARTAPTAFVINFSVEKEDGVYPMIAPGAALHEMVRRPQKDPLLETAEDE